VNLSRPNDVKRTVTFHPLNEKENPMRNQSMRTTNLTWAPAILPAALGLIFSATTASGATITDPTLASGSGAINPNNLSLDAGDQPGDSTPMATLEARSDFRVLQDYAGFTSTGGANNPNIVNFVDSAIPDIRFDYTGGPNSEGEERTDTTTSSGNSSMRLQGEAVLLITFGTYDSGSSTFTADRTSDAASFMFNGWRFAGGGEITLTVDYLDSQGDTIKSQSVTQTATADGPPRNTYFAWEAPSIAAVSFTRTGDFKSNIHAFDDFGFTIIPEPGSLALMGLGGLLMLGRGRRAR